MKTVACVLRSGGEYKPEHVLVLANQFARFVAPHPYRFVCLTDVPIPGSPDIEQRPLRKSYPKWWAKMELFAPAHDDLGDVLYLDLDTMIVGTMFDDIFRVQQLTLLEDFYKPGRLQSGLMHLPVTSRTQAQAAWLDGPDDVMQFYRGDGEFLESVFYKNATTWQREVPNQVVSYKVHCRANGVPAGAQIVCFHGKPRPWETKLWDK